MWFQDIGFVDARNLIAFEVVFTFLFDTLIAPCGAIFDATSRLRSVFWSRTVPWTNNFINFFTESSLCGVSMGIHLRSFGSWGLDLRRHAELPGCHRRIWCIAWMARKKIIYFWVSKIHKIMKTNNLWCQTSSFLMLLKKHF